MEIPYDDDDFDDDYKRDEPESERDEWVLACGYPGCCMPGYHFRSECHNAEDMERLWERKKLIWGSFDMEPTRLLIGAEDYAELMQEQYSKQCFDFRAEYVSGRNGHPQIMGLRVEVVPWMRGMVLLK